MKPIINLEENIGKTVGRRTAPDPLQPRSGDVEESKAWRRNFGGIPVPRGVFRFHSHEEADAWLMKYLTKKKTS